MMIPWNFFADCFNKQEQTAVRTQQLEYRLVANCLQVYNTYQHVYLNWATCTTTYISIYLFQNSLCNRLFISDHLIGWLWWCDIKWAVPFFKSAAEDVPFHCQEYKIVLHVIPHPTHVLKQIHPSKCSSYGLRCVLYRSVSIIKGI